MAELPLYDPAGTQRTDRMQSSQLSPDALGASSARALTQLGEQTQQLGGELARLKEIETEKDAATEATDAYTTGTRLAREQLYGEGGIYTRTGTQAAGITNDAYKTSDQIFQSINGKLSPKAQAAFKSMWGKFTESTANSAASREADQRQATRTATKTAALANLTDAVITDYNDEEMLATHFDAAKKFIKANADGLPAETVTQMERESVSTLHLSVIQRLTQDDPGRALDYYERHKGGIAGTDHTTANALIKGVATARDAKQGADEIANGGPAWDIMRSIVHGETGGEAVPGAAVSPVGAAGDAQLMPDTAREVARGLTGMDDIAAMDDKQLQAYWQTPKGRQDNIRIGATYLNKQLNRFKGDVEAAAIAYNAGPENAEKWLNAGRDYAALPKPEETLPYVKRVMGHHLGVAIEGNTSADIQRAAKGGGGSYEFKGDAPSFLMTKLQKHHGPDHIQGMTPALQNRLASLFTEAPDFVKDGLDILSGTRTRERQVQLFAEELARQGGNVAAARKNVAPASGTYGSKGSNHEHGNASDLGWKGGKFANAPKEVKEWLHANAGKYGLKFPLGHEDWHIETQETRGGAAAKGARVTAGDVVSARADQRVGQAFEDRPMRVEVDNTVGNAGDVYAKLATPFALQPTAGNLDTWLSEAREKYAGNPSMLAEVERQLTEEYRMRGNAQKGEVDNTTLEVFRGLMGGKKVADFDPLQLEKIGPDGVSKLLTLEGKLKPGADDKTDDGVYYKLSQMDPKEFQDTNLIEFADKLSGDDFRKLADRQATLKRPNTTAGQRATDLTRTQIVSNAQDILALKPNERPADATTMAALNRALNGKIAAHIEANGGKEPDGDTMQKMVDDLLLTGQLPVAWGPDKTRRMFELTPEELGQVEVVDSFESIPAEEHGRIATTFKKIYQVDPNEDAAVDFYNDLARVKLGAAPMPPATMATTIRQALAGKLNRKVEDDEIATFYREWIIRAQAQ